MSNYFYPLVENPYRNKDINKAIQVLKTNKLRDRNFGFQLQIKFV